MRAAHRSSPASGPARMTAKAVSCGNILRLDSALGGSEFCRTKAAIRSGICGAPATGAPLGTEAPVPGCIGEPGAPLFAQLPPPGGALALLAITPGATGDAVGTSGAGGGGGGAPMAVLLAHGVPCRPAAGTAGAGGGGVLEPSCPGSPLPAPFANGAAALLGWSPGATVAAAVCVAPGDVAVAGAEAGTLCPSAACFWAASATTFRIRPISTMSGLAPLIGPSSMSLSCSSGCKPRNASSARLSRPLANTNCRTRSFESCWAAVTAPGTGADATVGAVDDAAAGEVIFTGAGIAGTTGVESTAGSLEGANEGAITAAESVPGDSGCWSPDTATSSVCPAFVALESSSSLFPMVSSMVDGVGTHRFGLPALSMAPSCFGCGVRPSAVSTLSLSLASASPTTLAV
mmetsp:Transcript_108985/g.303838  ORF Transcript_108985/g.303838 Transcript_108985/m.303838 type:complete len:404 (+) Transcript_108985:675-1886(+)